MFFVSVRLSTFGNVYNTTEILHFSYLHKNPRLLLGVVARFSNFSSEFALILLFSSLSLHVSRFFFTQPFLLEYFIRKKKKKEKYVKYTKDSNTILSRKMKHLKAISSLIISIEIVRVFPVK